MIFLATLVLLLCSGATADSPLRGVTEPTSRVELFNSNGTIIASTVADAHGEFNLGPVPPGSYLLRVSKEGYAGRTLSVRVPSAALRVDLTLAPVVAEITVTASRGHAEDAADLAPLVTVRDRDEILARPLRTIGHAFHPVAGVMVQQSTTAQVSPFLRGLTGYHVLNLLDGVRFNNATFRSGPNQYLAFIEPSQAGSVEAMLGPAGAQYGSDSLGGTIQVITLEARYAPQPEWHGEAHLFGASADLSCGLSGFVSRSTPRSFILGGGSVRRHDDVRAGGGVDSRHVFVRFFGLPELARGRLQDTAFSQQSVFSKVALQVAPSHNLTFWLQSGDITRSRGYKDLLGGLGRLRSDFDPQRLHLFYARYEKIGLGLLDNLSATFSVNDQRDGSIRQGLRLTDAVTRDDTRVTAFGYAAQAATHLGSRHVLVFGGEAYDERIDSGRLENGAPRRPLYPDDSRYLTGGLFAQDSLSLLSGRLRATLTGRLTWVRYRTFADDSLGVAASDQVFSDATFSTSLLWQATSHFGVHFLAGRGFRAPNANDLGAVGLNDLGYEIPASQAVTAGALLATSAGEGALSTGRRLGTTGPERLYNFEAGLRFQARRFSARVQVFDAELLSPIVRRTLLFPASQAPSTLGGLPVTPIAPTLEQQQQGVVAVATGVDPRAVKAFTNDGHARYYGVESLFEYTFLPAWRVAGGYTFIYGRELNPNRPVRRLPPQQGYLSLRQVSRRIWWQATVVVTGDQRRLSGGDVDDERIGASRRRRDIADFFNGSRVAPLLDGNRHFVPTGETLLQIQERVLPLGAVINGVRVVDDNTRVPLYLRTAGSAQLDLQTGIALGERWSLSLGLMNALDRNYRIHGSGIDAPGRDFYLGLLWRF